MGSTLWEVDWSGMFMPSRSILEMFLRGTTMYFVIVALLKLVVKRQTGGVGRTDILMIVLLAEIAGPGFTAACKDELMTQMREEGIAELSDVKEACMEPDGMISIIRVDRSRAAS